MRVWYKISNQYLSSADALDVLHHGPKASLTLKQLQSTHQPSRLRARQKCRNNSLKCRVGIFLAEMLAFFHGCCLDSHECTATKINQNFLQISASHQALLTDPLLTWPILMKESSTMVSTLCNQKLFLAKYQGLLFDIKKDCAQSECFLAAAD